MGVCEGGLGRQVRKSVECVSEREGEQEWAVLTMGGALRG